MPKQSKVDTSFRHSEETKRKLSEMRQGSKNPFFGRKHTPETREKLASILREHAPDGTLLVSARSIKDFTDVEAAYLAGIIDGEGSIYYRSGRPGISVYNNDKRVMDWLKRHIGANYTATDTRGRNPGYTWQSTAARDVYFILNRVLPFLVIKQDRAISAIDHLRSKYGDVIDE